MEKNNLTIQDVYEKTGVSRNTISQMINKEPRGIQFETLEKILNGLNLGVAELITYEIEEKPFVLTDVTEEVHEEIENDDYLLSKGGYFNYVEIFRRNFWFKLEVVKEINLTLSFPVKVEFNNTFDETDYVTYASRLTIDVPTNTIKRILSDDFLTKEEFDDFEMALADKIIDESYNQFINYNIEIGHVSIDLNYSGDNQ